METAIATEMAQSAKPKLADLVQKARAQLAEVTGLKPVAVTAVSKDHDLWHIRVEMLEMSRIPTATDVLGEYEVLLAEDGGMVRFERKRTRLRGAPTEMEKE
ncbi:MAG: gas vesicle protein [Chloroflexi bacterium]|nr:gas vesicle protein [Chloroflexota bacterium]